MMVHDFTIRVNISHILQDFLRGQSWAMRWILDFSVGNEEGLTLYILLTRKSSKSEAFQCSFLSFVSLRAKRLALNVTQA